jgi:hypothetical protein
LKTEGVLTSPIAKFWEGALGNTRYKESSVEVVHQALDANGIYLAVGYRKSLCDAMFQRDIGAMGALINEIEGKSVDGGLALILAKRLLSDILCIQRDAINLEALANNHGDHSHAEEFLLSCAVSGYNGTEAEKAVSIREQLIRWASIHEPDKVRELLQSIKQKAFLTNLMLSRDMEGLSDAVVLFTGKDGNAASSSSSQGEKGGGRHSSHVRRDCRSQEAPHGTRFHEKESI